MGIFERYTVEILNMRLLFYSHFSTLYGASRSLVNLILGIKNQDPSIEIHVIIPENGPLCDYLTREYISFSVIPHYFWIYNNELSTRKKKENYLLWKTWYFKNKWEKGFRNNIYFKRHIQFVKKYSPDYIYVNSSLAPMGAKVADRLKIPFIWHHRETLNDPETGYYLEDPKSFYEFFKKARLHIYPSKFLRDFYPKVENGFIAFNGVNFITEKCINMKTPNTISSLKFGVVGRINPQKDQEGLVSVFKALNEKYRNQGFDHELHIIGDGDNYYIDQIKNSIKNQNIYFKGFLKTDEIFKNMDFLIVNANNEAFGRVVAEANFNGIPVIAKDSGALSEIVTPGSNGFLFKGPTELSALLESLILNFRENDYIDLSEKSRLEFEKKFTIEHYCSSILSEISKLNQKNFSNKN